MAPIARKRIPRTKKLSPMSYTNAEPAYSMDAALELDEGVQVYNRAEPHYHFLTQLHYGDSDGHRLYFRVPGHITAL